jgi:predicted methyltransferase
MAENSELELDAGRFDVIMMALSYHNLHYAAPQNVWPKIDTVKLLAKLYRDLKPGGTPAMIDHFAEAGAPRETVGRLHRIDPSIVVSELEAAGFVLDAKSGVLRNMHDDHGKPVFDPAVRGRTDRFVMRFRKPRWSAASLRSSGIALTLGAEHHGRP